MTGDTDEKIQNNLLVLVKESHQSTFFPDEWVLYPNDPVNFRWNMFHFTHK